jgi:hypothetical protein
MLPKIDVPVYNIKLLSTGKEVKFRPFTVKEHKILLMAAESKATEDILGAIRQIIRNCVIDDIDVDDLATVDFEMLFLNIRAKSVGEVVDLKYKCKNKIDEENKCEKPFTLKINLIEDLHVNNLDSSNNKIPLSESIGIVLKYPTARTLQDMIKYVDTEENMADMNLTSSCIDYIYDGDEIYYAKESTREELNNFVDNLSTEQYNKIEEFFKNIPSIYAEKQHTCTKCGYEHKMRLEGIADFFT